MSVKFQRETVKTASEAAASLGVQIPTRIPGTSGDHPIAEAIGTALTGGKKNAGTKAYLGVSREGPGPACLHAGRGGATNGGAREKKKKKKKGQH